MTKTVSIDGATINSDNLTKFLQRGISILAEAEAAKEDFKALVEEIEQDTKLEKKVISKWIKARYADKTKVVIAEGEAVAALNDAVDN